MKGLLISLNKQKSMYLSHLAKKDDVSTNKHKAYRNQLKKLLRYSKHQYFLNKCK